VSERRTTGLLVAAAFAAFRGARAVTGDSITDSLRERLLVWTIADGLTDEQVARREWLAGNANQGSSKTGLLACPHCTGAWLSWIATAAVLGATGQWRRQPLIVSALQGWAVAGLQSLLTSTQVALDALDQAALATAEDKTQQS
jgi:hypothetical protein